MEHTIGFIGAGAMAEALVAGMIKAQVVSPSQIYVTNRQSHDRLVAMGTRYGVHVHAPGDIEKICSADVVVLAMKPKDVQDVLYAMRSMIQPETLIVSILAGVGTSVIEEGMDTMIPVVRAMPNTSSAVLDGATAIAAGRYANSAHMDIAKALFQAVGCVVTVSEDQIHTVTGLSGSGPAYVYTFAEALIAAGVAGGLTEDVARELALHTIMGAGTMLRHTGESPSELRQKVTSPNGTTMAGLIALEEHGFAIAIRAAVRRATDRSREMSVSIQEHPRDRSVHRVEKYK